MRLCGISDTLLGFHHRGSPKLLLLLRVIGTNPLRERNDCAARGPSVALRGWSMKKTLLASTALVAVAALAAPASAAEKINVSVGGYMQQWFGWAENDSPAEDGFDQKNDTEIHFKGSTLLDNGLEVGIQVELEGQTEGDQIDESYLWVEGGFGRLVMGKENGANYLMHYAPIEAGIGMNRGDIFNS